MSVIDTRTLPERGLTREFYVDEACFERDLERLFRTRWLYVGHESQIREAGSWMTFELAPDSVIVIRNDDDALYAFHNVCRHRGARLLSAGSGSCSRIVCPYHGWTYERNGALRAAPRMHEGFSVNERSLRKVWLATWNGMVFVNLSPQAPEPLEFALGRADLSEYDVAHTKVVRDATHVVDANWKVFWENGLECYHCAVNHPELKNVVELIRSGAQPSHIEAGEVDFRPDYPILPGLDTYSIDGRLRSRLLGDPEAPPDHVTFLQWHTTAFELIASPDHVALTMYKPLSAGRTELRMVLLVHEDAVEGQDFDVDELNEFHALVRGQDDGLCEEVQKGLASRSFDPGVFNRDYEFMLQNFTRIYLDAVTQSDGG